MLHGIQLIELRATCRRDKLLQEFLLHISKLSAHMSLSMSLLHVVATCPCVLSLWRPLHCTLKRMSQSENETGKASLCI
ncbi:hypothetical protein ACROYT_G040509 [Oculina patagonica]